MSDLGTTAWLARTNGRMSTSERLSLLFAMPGVLIEGLRLRRFARRSGRNAPPLAQLDAPDTPMVHAARARLLATSGTPMANHCFRTAYWTVLVMHVHGDVTPIDRETAWVAALLHDIGLEDPPARGDFSARGVEVLKDLALEHGWPDEQVHFASEAIVTNLGLRVDRVRSGTVAWAMNVGGSGEVGFPPHRAQMDRARVAEIEALYPRTDFKREAMKLIRAEARRVPGGRFAWFRWLFPLIMAGCHRGAPSLDGVWGAEVDLARSPHAVRLAFDRAEIDGRSIALADGVARTGDGALVVRFATNGPHAYWTQPAGTMIGPYATHVDLSRDGDTWIGTIAAVPDRVRLYLVIRPDGTAFVREAERNLGKELGELTVERDGGALTFRDGKGAVALRGHVDGDHLELAVPRLERPLPLTRRGRDDAPGFYPRPSRDAHYTYRVPVAGSDGWPVAALDHPETVEPIVQAIVDAVPTSATSPAIHALVVARRGKLVLDEHFAGDGPDDLHDLRSAGKTMSTTLVGMAVDERDLAVTDRVAPLLGDQPGHDAIAVEHLLTMRSGLACDDGDDASPGNEDTMQNQTAQPDWYRYTWELPMARAPGDKALYCSATINLLGAVLVAHHHVVADDFFDEFAAPLDISRAAIVLMPDGRAYLGGGVRLRARDFLKVAQLAVDRGEWRGRRIVSADWIANATAAHASITDPDDYGYGWWRIHYTVGGRAIDAVYASGNGGQLAIAVPALDIAIAITAGNYNNAKTWRAAFLADLVPKLLAAIGS